MPRIPKPRSRTDKENVWPGEAPVNDDNRSGVIPPKMSMADELEEMTKKMNMIAIEKEKTELLLKEREAELEQKAAAEQHLQVLLEAKEREQKKLTEKVRKLQKAKEFQPNIDFDFQGAGGSCIDSKKKDPKHIKKPLIPFILWSKDQREQIKKENPQASFAEMSKLLGDKWKTVSDEEKKPYEDRYHVEKEVYLKIVGEEKREVEAMKIFQEEQNKKMGLELLEQYLRFKNEDNADGKKKRKEKDPEKPKKPTSAFFVFSNEQRPKLLAEKMKVTEIGKKLGEEWKDLDEAARGPYERVAAEDKARYATELEAYKIKKAGELEEAEGQSKEQALIRKAQGLQLLKEREQIMEVKKTLKEEKIKKKRSKAAAVDPNKPKKPVSSYILFVMENRKLITQKKPGASFAEITSTLAIRWQELPEAEKQVWANKAAAARESYKIALEEYNKTSVKVDSLADVE